MADNAAALTQIQEAGVPTTYLDTLRSQGKSGPLRGMNLDPQDVQGVISSYNAYQSSPGVAIPKAMQQLASQEYQFDPNQYLPGIQQQADSIYSPQKAQLEAIRQLQASQYQAVRDQTTEQFDKQLQQEIEAINARGAFFGGGAIQNEGDIRTAKSRALTQLGLQAQAADFSNYAQQAMLAAEQAQFIQDRLYNAESSAYARWTDQRNFSMQALQTQYQVFANERDFARSVFESDRAYAFEKEKWDVQVEQFKQQYDITQAQFEMAQKEFKVDMDMKKLSYEQALSKFKSSYATTNTGILGVNINGGDIYDSIASTYTGGLGGYTYATPNQTTIPGGILNLDIFN